jgi:arginyl-tRNA synthetase
VKEHIAQILAGAVAKLQDDDALPGDIAPAILVERTREREHGDFASNLALTLAKAARCKPRELAERLVAAIDAGGHIERIEIAGPGFINFFLLPGAYRTVIDAILEQASRYGRSSLGAGQRIQVEFVSANPTGPLRGSRARRGLWRRRGRPARGRRLACTVNTASTTPGARWTSWRRASICATSSSAARDPVSANGYQGDYVWDIGATIHREQGERLPARSPSFRRPPGG